MLQLVLLGVVAILGALALPAAGGLVPTRWPVLAGGLLLMGLGGIFVGRGVSALRTSLSAFPRPMPTATLVTTGIYARIRHPIYSGLVSLSTGWALTTLSLSAFVAALALGVVLDLKSRREEEWLAERFPEYSAYRTRSARFLPGLY